MIDDQGREHDEPAGQEDAPTSQENIWPGGRQNAARRRQGICTRRRFGRRPGSTLSRHRGIPIHQRNARNEYHWSGLARDVASCPLLMPSLQWPPVCRQPRFAWGYWLAKLCLCDLCVKRDWNRGAFAGPRIHRSSNSGPTPFGSPLLYHGLCPIHGPVCQQSRHDPLWLV